MLRNSGNGPSGVRGESAATLAESAVQACLRSERERIDEHTSTLYPLIVSLDDQGAELPMMEPAPRFYHLVNSLAFDGKLPVNAVIVTLISEILTVQKDKRIVTGLGINQHEEIATNCSLTVFGAHRAGKTQLLGASRKRITTCLEACNDISFGVGSDEDGGSSGPSTKGVRSVVDYVTRAQFENVMSRGNDPIVINDDAGKLFEDLGRDQNYPVKSLDGTYVGSTNTKRSIDRVCHCSFYVAISPYQFASMSTVAMVAYIDTALCSRSRMVWLPSRLMETTEFRDPVNALTLEGEPVATPEQAPSVSQTSTQATLGSDDEETALATPPRVAGGLGAGCDDTMRSRALFSARRKSIALSDDADSEAARRAMYAQLVRCGVRTPPRVARRATWRLTVAPQVGGENDTVKTALTDEEVRAAGANMGYAYLNACMYLFACRKVGDALKAKTFLTVGGDETLEKGQKEHFNWLSNYNSFDAMSFTAPDGIVALNALAGRASDRVRVNAFGCLIIEQTERLLGAYEAREGGAPTQRPEPDAIPGNFKLFVAGYVDRNRDRLKSDKMAIRQRHVSIGVSLEAYNVDNACCLLTGRTPRQLMAHTVELEKSKARRRRAAFEPPAAREEDSDVEEAPTHIGDYALPSGLSAPYLSAVAYKIMFAPPPAAFKSTDGIIQLQAVIKDLKLQNNEYPGVLVGFLTDPTGPKRKAMTDRPATKAKGAVTIAGARLVGACLVAHGLITPMNGRDDSDSVKRVDLYRRVSVSAEGDDAQAIGVKLKSILRYAKNKHGAIERLMEMRRLDLATAYEEARKATLKLGRDDYNKKLEDKKKKAAEAARTRETTQAQQYIEAARAPLAVVDNTAPQPEAGLMSPDEAAALIE